MNLELAKSLLSNTPKNPNIETLIEGLRTFKLADDELPLSNSRFPFLEISDKAIISSVIDTLQFPEKLGRLSNIIRKYLEIPIDCPVNFAVKEAHLDINEVKGNLYNDLIEIGFEPDHFFELNPPDYHWCFTLKYEIPHFDIDNQNRLHFINNELINRAKKAQEAVDADDNCYGYLEVESYSSRNKFTFVFKPVSRNGLASFPFKEGHFVNFNLPSTLEESVNTNTSLSSHKIVDIHVKVPSIYRGVGFEEAGNSEMESLRKLFLLAGFYEIYSEAGNYIYTVQLLDSRKGKKIADILINYAQKWGGIAQIKLEICNYFWRKEYNFSDKRLLSPIPPLVK